MTIRGKKVLVAAVGDSNSPVTWSGIPFHLLQAGRRLGLVDAGMALKVGGGIWSARRAFWNATQVLRGSRLGGYQYSPQFLEALWRPFRQEAKGDIVINCFQLFPPSVVQDKSVEKWFFIDQTLQQLFDYYELRATIGRKIAQTAVEMEAQGYAHCSGVIAHSAWAARSVVEDYGVEPSRVFVAVPGANLDAEAYSAWEQSVVAKSGSREIADVPLKLVFVGKHPVRKGLDRLLRAVQIARSRGSNCELSVIGCRQSDLPSSLRNVLGVTWLGFIDKRRDAQRFLRVVADHDVGCLLSRAEAGGIGLREYHALGLAALAPDTGGSPEHALAGASLLVKPEEDDNAIADRIGELDGNRALLARMKALAWSRRREFLWESTMSIMAKLLESDASPSAFRRKSSDTAK